MKNTYFIGGSPCSGKSTAAEILSREYGLYYFKVDDFLEKYMELGAQDGLPLCKKIAGMSAEQIWMREAQLQCREEFGIYEEIFDYILADLDQLNSANGILTEGAAYVPRLFKRLGLPGGRYIAVTPTPEFQIDHYRQRAFVPYVLADCPDKEQAFRNWMYRDILYAQEVRRQCREEGYSVITNDGSIPMDELAGSIAARFGLKMQQPPGRSATLTSGNPR